MDAFSPTIAIEALAARIATPQAPLLLDLRPESALAREPILIPGARHRPLAALERWRHDLPRGPESIVLYGEEEEAVRAAAARLEENGHAAAILAGGLAAWRGAGLPTVRSLASCGLGAAPSRWVTRARPKIDRIACPWLIRRFIDPEARILYVPSAEVPAAAKAGRAEPFDTEGARFGHHGEKCSFDAFVAIFEIGDDALDGLATIVRGADTGRPDLAPEAPGLLAVSRGLSALFADDHAMLAHGMTVYDALYAQLRAERSGNSKRGQA
jgi:rhodanese-related sulfurtransferase